MIARDYFHLQNVTILLLEEETQELYPRSQIGWDEGKDFRVPIGVGITGTAAQQKRPIYSPDVSQDSRYISTSKTTRSELAMPLMVRDEVVGVLDCQSDNPDHFDPDTVDLLTLFSIQASMALQNARLYSLERRRASQLEVINAIAQQMTAVLDIKELLHKVCLLVQHAFQVSHVSVSSEGRRRTGAAGAPWHADSTLSRKVAGCLLEKDSGDGFRARENPA